MDEDRRRLIAILDLLDASTEAVIRADLAVELVGVAARYEDVKERAVYPVIASHALDPNSLARAETE